MLPLITTTHQYAAPLKHVCPVEDGLLVIIMLEADHQRRPPTNLRPEEIKFILWPTKL